MLYLTIAWPEPVHSQSGMWEITLYYPELAAFEHKFIIFLTS